MMHLTVENCFKILDMMLATTCDYGFTCKVATKTVVAVFVFSTPLIVGVLSPVVALPGFAARRGRKLV